MRISDWSSDVCSSDLASILVGVAVGWLVVNRMVIRRLHRLADSMRTIAGGEHDVEVDTRGRDEVTEMAHAVAVFRDNAIEMERMRGAQVAAERRASEDPQVPRGPGAEGSRRRHHGHAPPPGRAARGKT